jgi:hypothetical protein
MTPLMFVSALLQYNTGTNTVSTSEINRLFGF